MRNLDGRRPTRICTSWDGLLLRVSGKIDATALSSGDDRISCASRRPALASARRYSKGIGVPDIRQQKLLWLPPDLVPRLAASGSGGAPTFTSNRYPRLSIAGSTYASLPFFVDSMNVDASGASTSPNAGMGLFSIIALLMSTATGLRSLAYASSPSLCASRGSAPPPATDHGRSATGPDRTALLPADAPRSRYRSEPSSPESPLGRVAAPSR